MKNNLRELKENEVYVLLNESCTGTNIFSICNDRMIVIKAYTEICSKDELILKIVNINKMPRYSECYSIDSINNKIRYNDICRLSEVYKDCYIVIALDNNEICIKGFIQITKLNQTNNIFNLGRV